MSLSAITSAGDAIDLTREYLFAQSIRRYLLLAVMSVFLGPAGVSGPPGPVEIRDGAFQTDGGDFPSLEELVATIDVTLIFVAIVAIISLLVGYALVSALVELAFVHSLANRTVQLRRPAREHWRKAIGLFVFRAIVWGALAAWSLAMVLVLFDVIAVPFGLDVVLFAAVAFVLGVATYLLNRLTTDFVVPVMLHEDRNIVGGWVRFAGVVHREWRQYAVYVPVRLLLEVALGIAIGVVAGLGFLAIAIVLGIPLGVVLFIALGPTGIAITIVILAVAAVVAGALVIVPFHTYLRYYSLLVLGDTEAGLDLIPGMRSLARDERPV